MMKSMVAMNFFDVLYDNNYVIVYRLIALKYTVITNCVSKIEIINFSHYVNANLIFVQ